MIYHFEKTANLKKTIDWNNDQGQTKITKATNFNLLRPTYRGVAEKILFFRNSWIFFYKNDYSEKK